MSTTKCIPLKTVNVTLPCKKLNLWMWVISL